MSRMWEVDPETKTKVCPPMHQIGDGEIRHLEDQITDIAHFSYSSSKSPKPMGTTNAATAAPHHLNGYDMTSFPFTETPAQQTRLESNNSAKTHITNDGTP